MPSRPCARVRALRPQTATTDPPAAADAGAPRLPVRHAHAHTGPKLASCQTCAQASTCPLSRHLAARQARLLSPPAPADAPRPTHLLTSQAGLLDAAKGRHFAADARLCELQRDPTG